MPRAEAEQQGQIGNVRLIGLKRQGDHLRPIIEGVLQQRCRRLTQARVQHKDRRHTENVCGEIVLAGEHIALKYERRVGASRPEVDRGLMESGRDRTAGVRAVESAKACAIDARARNRRTAIVATGQCATSAVDRHLKITRQRADHHTRKVGLHIVDSLFIGREVDTHIFIPARCGGIGLTAAHREVNGKALFVLTSRWIANPGKERRCLSEAIVDRFLRVST